MENKGTIEMFTLKKGSSGDKYITGTARVMDSRNRDKEDYGIISVIVTREAKKKLEATTSKKVKLYMSTVQAIVGLNDTVGIMVTDFGAVQEIK